MSQFWAPSFFSMMIVWHIMTVLTCRTRVSALSEGGLDFRGSHLLRQTLYGPTDVTKLYYTCMAQFPSTDVLLHFSVTKQQRRVGWMKQENFFTRPSIKFDYLQYYNDFISKTNNSGQNCQKKFGLINLTHWKRLQEIKCDHYH